MKKSIGQLIDEQKRHGEETEFYPTTERMVKVIHDQLKDGFGYEPVRSILDIGCGNGSFFQKFDTLCADNSRCRGYKKYGIEKSFILAEQMEDIVLLGTDFYEQTLIDKKVDVIFCNPPYSDFETWLEKIILEGNCRKMFFVVPVRWKESERIKNALKKRDMMAVVLDTQDFNTAEAERRARTIVDVLEVKPSETEYAGRKYTNKVKDPFELWFDETFSINAEKSKLSTFDKEEQKKNELIAQGDTAEMLVRFYNEDMQKLYSNYRALEKLDPELFNELHVDVSMLKESLKKRLQGLKIFYWDLLFKKYERITTRLTTKGRDRVIKRLKDNTAIDFTLENIYQMTMWIINHSNTLFDEQITDLFYRLCDADNIHRYKSNKHWNEDSWRYLKDELKKKHDYWNRQEVKDKIKTLKDIRLDYRIVTTGFRNFDFSWSSSCRLVEDSINFIFDLTVIGRNLGFDIDLEVPTQYTDIDFGEWRNKDILCRDGTVFCNLKLYQNGNRHVKFNKEFMKKFNVEMARINGWINNKADAMEEFDISAEEIDRYWKSNNKIELAESSVKLLGIA